MKKTILHFLTAAFIFFVGFSCREQQKESAKTEHEAVFEVLDSLQKIYAPDKRIDLWKFEFQDETDTLVGYVYDQKAYNDVKHVFESKFPELGFDLKLLPAVDNKQIVDAVITNSVATIRGEPRHSAEIVTQALMGTPVKILKNHNPWILVQLPNRYIGWAYKYELTKVDPQKLAELKLSPKVVYTNQAGFSYSKANKNSRVVSDLVPGCIMWLTDSINEFYKVKYADDREAFIHKKKAISAQVWLTKKPVKENLLAVAEKFMGLPYLWGGTSAKAIDCSGFTSSVYLMNGILLRRDASQQTLYGKEIANDNAFDELEIGDLLFFGRKATPEQKERVTHVAMYIGNSEFIHASGKVRINSVDSMRENYAEYYTKHFVRARRIIGQVDNEGIERIENNEFYKEIF